MIILLLRWSIFRFPYNHFMISVSMKLIRVRLEEQELHYKSFEFIFSYKYFIKNYKCLEELIKITYDPIISSF